MAARTWKEMNEPMSLEEYAGEVPRPIPRPTLPADAWVQLPQNPEAGESGSGYYTYGTDETKRPGTGANAQWGPPRTMQVISSVAGQLGNGQGETPFGVGNISLEGGRSFPPHEGHTDGLGMDIRPARQRGEPGRVDYRSPDYDRAATQRLLRAFIGTGQVDKIYFNDPDIGVEGVSPWPKHDDHFHVQLKP
jgi:penicillin-insensitive murein endopeptidase